MRFNVVLVVLLYMSSLASIEAQSTQNDSLTIAIPSAISPKVIATEIVIPVNEESGIDITADHWESTVYNPYKDESVQFPLKITFKDSTFASPISREKVVTSRYGWRWGRAHQGIDIDLVTGDSVFAILDGIVRMATYNGGHGKTVVIRHLNGLETTYAHLSQYGVKVNDTVRKGQYIGKGGRTGNARGSHLHLVVAFKGQYIHPEYLFDFSESNRIRASEIYVTKAWTRAYYYSSRSLPKLNVITSEQELEAFKSKEKRLYIVKAGDTLSRISAKNNISIEALCQSNAIRRNSVLKIGQKLLIEP